MKKILHFFLSILMAISTAPLNALASEIITTPPIFVRVMDLNKDVVQLKNNVLNQERANRDEEFSAVQLAEENAVLAQKVEELQQQVSSARAKSKENDFVASVDSLDQLREVMENYSLQLDERNRQLMAHNEETRALRARIAQLEQTAQANNKYIENLRQSSAELDQQEESLITDLKDQKDFLIFKNKSSVEKYQQLLDYKSQLAVTKEDLQKIKGLYQKFLESSGQKQQEASAITEDLKSQAKRLREYQASLQDKDKHMSQLEDLILQKDNEIAQLKAALASAHDQLTKAKRELAAKDKIIGGQQRVIEGLNQDMGQMKQNVFDLQKDYARYDESFERIRENVLVLQSKLASAQQRAADADVQEKDLIKLKGDVAALTYQLKTSQEDSQQYQNQIQQLNATIDGLTAQVVAKNKELQDKSTQISQLQQQLQANSSYEATIKELQTQVSTLTDQAAALKVSVTGLLNIKERLGLYETLFSKYRLLERLAAEKCDLLTQLSQKNEQEAGYFKDQLKKTILYWQGLNQNNENQLQNLTKETTDKQQQIADLQTQLKGSKEQVIQLGSMLDVYQNKIDQRDIAYKKKTQVIDKLQGDLQTAQDNLTQRDDDLKKVKAYFFELEQKSSAKTQELREKSQQLALANATLDQQTQDLSALTEKLTVAEEKLKTSVDKSEVEKTKQLLAVASDEASTLKASLTQKDNEIEQLKRQSLDNADLQKELGTVKDKVAKLMEDLYSKDEQIRNFKSQASKKDQTIDSLNKQLENSGQRLHEALLGNDAPQIHQVLGKTQKQLKALKKELNDKQEIIDRMQEDQTTVDDLREQLNEARGETRQAKAAARDKNEQTQHLASQVKSLNLQIQDLQNKIENMQISSREQSLNKTNMQDTIKELRSKLNEITKEKSQQKNALREDSQNRTTSLIQQVQEQKDQISALNKEIDDLNASGSKGDYAGMKARIQQMTKDLDEQNQKMDALSGQLKEKTVAYDRQQKEMSQLRGQLKAAWAQVNQLGVSVKTVEETYPGSPGNEGYLIREGKDASNMLYQVGGQIKTMEEKIEELNQNNQEYKAKYEIAMKELKQTRQLLEKCQSKLSVQAVFPNTSPSWNASKEKDSVLP